MVNFLSLLLPLGLKFKRCEMRDVQDFTSSRYIKYMLPSGICRAQIHKKIWNEEGIEKKKDIVSAPDS